MTADPERRFRELYERHYSALLGYALRRSTSAADAHDVVADTFLVLWRRLKDAPSSDEEVLLWLYGVARRVLANRHRTRQRQDRLAQRFAEAINQSTTTEDVATHRRNAQRLLEALLQLSDSERELLMLAAWEQLSTSDIAGVLQCTENAAAIRLHRARKRLTEVYAKENDPSGHRTVGQLRLRRSKKRETDE